MGGLASSLFFNGNEEVERVVVNFFVVYLGYMTKKPMNFAKLLRAYKAGWVAISSDFRSVLFAGRNLKTVKERAQKIGEKVYFFPAGKSYSNLIG